jgi:translation initiation factor 2 beta subunit (eIF-2beta)/eIF-5
MEKESENMTDKMMDKGIQCRVQNSAFHIHVQAIGPVEMNRPYGGAWELRAPPEVVTWCEEQPPVYKSAASSGTYYVRMEVLMFETGAQALLIHGEEFNHPAGMMMGCNPKSPAVKSVIEYAYQTDMMTDAIFDDNVTDIVLGQESEMPEQEPKSLEEDEVYAKTVSEKLDDFLNEDDEHLASLVKHVAKEQAALDAKVVTSEITKSIDLHISLHKCKTCGNVWDGLPELISDATNCEGCGALMCDGCHFTPDDCELCGKEIHGGAVVWCKDCVTEPMVEHLLAVHSATQTEGE